MSAAVAAAIGVFAGTNVDDLVVLTALFVSAHASGGPRLWQIWVGQYLGIGILVAISGAAALGLTLVPANALRFLGIIPIAFGVRALIQALRGRAHEGSIAGAGLAAVVALTLANGGDNIAAYTPMFRLGNTTTNLTTIVVFVVLVGVWCAAGSWLASRRRVVRAIERFGHWLVPVTFIAIGVWVLV